MAAHAAVNGTVNVNQIEGSTLAAITGADINKDLDQAGDVSVVSHDYTNSAGLVGTASIGAIGAGVGLGSDTNTISRGVEAAVSGKTTARRVPSMPTTYGGSRSPSRVYLLLPLAEQVPV